MRRASTITHPTGLTATGGTTTGAEGTWTSISEKWPTWQIFRSIPMNDVLNFYRPDFRLGYKLERVIRLSGGLMVLNDNDSIL